MVFGLVSHLPPCILCARPCTSTAAFLALLFFCCQRPCLYSLRGPWLVTLGIDSGPWRCGARRHWHCSQRPTLVWWLCRQDVVCCSGLPTHRVHVPIIFPASLWVVFRIVVPMRTCLRCRIDFWPLIARDSLPPGAVSSPRTTKKSGIPFEICPSGRSMTI